MGGLFYRQRRYFALAVLLIVAVGLAAFNTIGRQEDPTITNIFATVVTPYPGADPARVEALVTEKIEDELRKIAEIKEIASTSRTGISVITVELADTIDADDLEQIWSEVRDALSDAARLFPQGVAAPEFDDNRTSAYPFGIQALIGVIGSIGVSINAAIIIITGFQQDESAATGDRTAIRNVVMQSSRHIVSTTVTTFGGFLPLILEGGGFWPPFAMSIAGGVLLSTVVSFYFVPPMFSLLVGRRRGQPVHAAQAARPEATAWAVFQPPERRP